MDVPVTAQSVLVPAIGSASRPRPAIIADLTAAELVDAEIDKMIAETAGWDDVSEADVKAFVGSDVESFAESDWSRDSTKRTANRWRNVKTGAIRYSATNPGTANPTTPKRDRFLGPEDNEATPSEKAKSAADAPTTHAPTHAPVAPAASKSAPAATATPEKPAATQPATPHTLKSLQKRDSETNSQHGERLEKVAVELLPIWKRLTGRDSFDPHYQSSKDEVQRVHDMLAFARQHGFMSMKQGLVDQGIGPRAYHGK